MNMGDRADRVQVLLHRFIERSLTLREDADQTSGRVRFFDQAHRGFPRDRERHERVGEKNRVAERQHWQLGWNLQRPLEFGGRLRRDRVLRVIRHDSTHKKRATGQSAFPITRLPDAEIT